MTPEPTSDGPQSKKAIVVAIDADKAVRILQLVGLELEASGDPHRPSVVNGPPRQSRIRPPRLRIRLQAQRWQVRDRLYEIAFRHYCAAPTSPPRRSIPLAWSVTSADAMGLTLLLENEIVIREFERIPTIEHAPVAVAQGV